MPSPIYPLLIPAPCMVCCHHIISARRFCLTSEVNGRRSAERARVESSRVESRVEFGCQAAARECQAQRLPQRQQQPPCHMHPAFTAAAATAATQQRSSPHIAAAAHCRLVWLSSARNQVESETRASAVALPAPPCLSSPVPLPLCGALLMWPRPRPRPQLDIIVIVVGLGFSFGCGLRSFRFVAGRAAAAD